MENRTLIRNLDINKLYENFEKLNNNVKQLEEQLTDKVPNYIIFEIIEKVELNIKKINEQEEEIIRLKTKINILNNIL